MVLVRYCRYTGIFDALLAIAILAICLVPNAAGFPINLGDLDEDGQATVLDLVRLLNHLNGVESLGTNSVMFADVTQDGSIDDADVDALTDAILGVTTLPNVYAAPRLMPTPPGTNGLTVPIRGMARPNSTLIAHGPRGAASVTANSSGAFDFEAVLESNRVNYLYISASNDLFTGVAQPVRILQDSEPPNLYIEFPTNGQVLMASSTVIAGRAGDSLSGSLGLTVGISNIVTTNAAVHIGTGNNGTFQGTVPLVPGTNLVRVTATDAFGNVSIRDVTVVGQDIATNAAILRLLVGDMQRTNVLRSLAQPVVVQALDGSANAMPGAIIKFKVSRSNGRLLPIQTNLLRDRRVLTNSPTRTTNGVTEFEISTDDAGKAGVWWTLGSDAGCGNNRLLVTCGSVVNSLFVVASADPGPATRINSGTGNNQSGEVRARLAEPLRAWVNDSRNGIEGVPVTFRVTRGDGKVNGQDMVTVLSSQTGHAEVSLELGPAAGDNIVEASFPGNAGLPAIFIARGVQRHPFRETSLSGLVLDNTTVPVPGAYCQLTVGGVTNGIFTDAQGRFTFSNTPAGSASVFVGSTLFLAPVEFSSSIVPNSQNSLPMPIVLPRIENLIIYDGSADLVLTCPGIEGLKMTIKAGSMRKPDGSPVSVLNPVIVSLNQVHHDELTAALIDGAAPRLAWTLQPAGATFETPVTVEQPNINGLPAGSTADIVLYDQRLGHFAVAIPAYVTADSTRIVTAVGAGLTTGGVGYTIPPHTTTGRAELKNVMLERGWMLRVNSQNAAQTDANAFGIANIPAGEGFRIAGFNIGGVSNLYAFSDYFGLQEAQTAVITNITVASEPFRTPEVLEIVASNRTVRAVETLPLAVMATFAEQPVEDVTASSRGTTYRVSNTNIASVSAEGVVTGVAPGVAHVSAVNDGVAVASAIQVLPGLTTVTGRIVDTNGLPVAGATVRVYDHGLAPVLTDTNGRFSISNTPATLGPISVSIRLMQDGVLLTASVRVWGIPAGETSAGPVTLRPFKPRPHAPFAGGFNHTLALRQDRSLWAWGGNDYGQIGDGTIVGTNLPKLVVTASNATWQSVAAGFGYSLAVDSEGTLWGWGANANGQLGNGTFDPTAIPQPLGTNKWRTIAAGGQHTLGIRDDHTLWAWGANESGQFGDGTFVSANTPQPIQTNVAWAAVAAGGRHTIALTADGSLWTWGGNDYGQSGTGTAADANTPQLIESNSVWTAVAAGEAHSIAMRDDGSIFAWGWNADGQLGDDTFADRNTPQLIATNTQWIAMAAGWHHTVAIRFDKTLWAWGANSYGQIGNGKQDTADSPQSVDTNTVWRSVAAGHSHTLALREDGSLWAWGWDTFGQLGNGALASANKPLLIGTNNTWTAVAAGWSHTTALRGTGTLWAWGWNGFGQLGLAKTISMDQPTQVGTSANWKSLAPTWDSTLALREDGTLWSWGWNDHGQLGLGNFTSTNFPQRVGSASDWDTIAAGGYHSLGLRQVGTLWAWGWGRYGQLGNGNLTNGTAPASVAGSAIWKKIAAGWDHTIALRDDATLWGWGWNGTGQLGDGTFADAGTPQPVEPDVQFQSVAAGHSHTVGLRADGTLWAWGNNDDGQLGNGTNYMRAGEPVPVATSATWRAVAAGAFHTVAIRSDGTLWAWGWNGYGQVGDGTFDSRIAPQLIDANTTWRAVTAGHSHTVALREDGTLWGWGANQHGQIGHDVPFLPHPVLGGPVWRVE